MKAELDSEVLNLITFRHSPANPGFGAGHNRNFDTCRWGNEDVFLIVNNDVEVRDSEVLTEMMSHCVPGTLVGCVITRSEDGAVWFAGGKISRITGDIEAARRRPEGATVESDILCGCCIMTRARDFADLNGFDEDFFMYAEDLDLAIRAAKGGYRLLIVNRSLEHQVGSGYAGRYSSLYLYESTKNRLICLKRHRLGLPLIGESYFIFKYLFARLVQLFLFSQAPVEQSKVVVRAFVDGLKARKAT
jgi:GT2 family glycosyltransferase